MKNLIKNFILGEEGDAMIEYILIAVFISIVILVYGADIKDAINGIWGKIEGDLTTNTP